MLNFGLLGSGVYTPSFGITINQTVFGSCDLEVANPCTATSTHQAVPDLATGTVSYTWSVIPSMGANGVVNGTFDTDLAGWYEEFNAVAVWENGRVLVEGTESASRITQSSIDVSGGKYVRLSAELEKLSGTGDPTVAFYSQPSDTLLHILNSAGSTHVMVPIGDSSLNIWLRANISISYFDNISIRELKSNPEIISGQGTDTVEVSDTKGSLGGDVVVNGTFDDGLNNWVAQNGETVNTSNQCVCNGANVGPMRQDGIMIADVNYEISIELIEYTSGEIYLHAGGAAAHVGPFSSVGVHKGQAVAIASNFEVEDRGFVGIIDNISVKEADAVDPDSSFILVCEATDDVATTSAASRVVHKRELFNGGMFVNGGFENGISSWKLYPTNGSWTATPDENTAQNIPNTTGTHFYQDFTLEAGATYEISADQVSGDGTVTYCINTADSGVAIADGPHRFVGVAAPESIGVTMSVAGTTPAVVDNLRLVKVSLCEGYDLCMTVGKSDTTEMYGYAPSAPTPYGSMAPSDFMGINIYNFNFNATNGTCAVSMGVAGDDKVGGYDNFNTTISGYPNGDVIFTWDDAQTRYKVIDTDLATYIKDNLHKEIGLTAVPLANNIVTHNGQIVTHNGEPVTNS